MAWKTIGVLVSSVFAYLQTASNATATEPPDKAAVSVSRTDWPWWRGYHRSGVAPTDQKPPLAWSEKRHVLWKTAVPGRGHGSPIVAGDRVFLATADSEAESQSVLCFDRKTGKTLWESVVHRGGLSKKGNRKATLASSTVACDGKRVFINFLNRGAIHTTALGLDGKIRWQTKITDYVVHQGYGSSPAIYGSLVIVSADNKGGGAIAGLNRTDGRIVWKHARPKTPNYPSPIILKINDRDQLLLTGCNLVSSYDPSTGRKLWETKGATTECVTSTVTDGSLVITSGGYPNNHVSAVRGDGSRKLVWKSKTRVYVPSMIARDGHLYAVTDAGVAVCWRIETGEEVWKKRLGGTFTSSLVLVGDVLFATNERGRTFLIKANPKAFELIGSNDLGNDVYSTPAICGGRIYHRVAFRQDGRRQEMLYCIGHSE